MPSKRKIQKLSAADMRSSRYGVPLITVRDPQDVVSEQFRVLRANIDFAAASIDKLQTVLFTSSEMSDGKSTVAQNLAVTWAQAGKRVLLVDADFRRPTLHRTFSIANDHGLTTVLAMNDQPAQVIHAAEEPNLFVMASGPMPPNPSELLGSDKMLKVLNWMKHEFDMIVIDSTPLLLVPDAQALIPRTDGVILVALLGKTKKKSLLSATRILKLAKAHVLGVVTRSPERTDKAYGYGYGYTSTNVMSTEQVKKGKAVKPLQPAKKTPVVATPASSESAAPSQSGWSNFGYTAAASDSHEVPAAEKEDPAPVVNEKATLVDIHSHILPGLDDGANSLNASLELAREAVSDGIKAIVATPHTMSAKYTNEAADVMKAVDAFQAELKKAAIDLTILPGQEVHLTGDLVSALDQGKLLTLADSKKYLLIELPDRDLPLFTHNVIFQLKSRGIMTIIAHPERNSYLLEHPEELNKLAERGALFQLTSASINGAFGKHIADFSIDLLRRGFVTTIASDAHNFADNRRYHLAEAYELIGHLLNQQLVTALKMNAARIITGEPVDSTTIEEF
ncbi:CpsB/CapC family capsule biosynthesis tyrosine phosphatase [Oenococcus sicerae]|uniref:Tyrosine-protein kinase CpsD n=1 Tax=Oenococcus sicerae TaxID=2203724 RepID=A0AAJ1RCV9_9LACO|nr:CpsB/CapC family capsule biosynthesis tyrosine phosphatase [Oenococcus sicerae]MDN6900645.1 polysaccharide biosynthesis tyrosine autokinase [Oenococcus sicerae]